MHGISRRAPTAEEAAKSSAEAQKLRALQSRLLQNHHLHIYSKEGIEVSSKLLQANPEFYTGWNYRKLAVEHLLSQPDAAVSSILRDELQLVVNALYKNPKSYGAWYHRKWILSKIYPPPRSYSIDEELKLLDFLFSKDSRNFHAWTYRRFVADFLMSRSEKDELDYTEYIIGKNFSNYSAWHNRSFLLSNLMKKNVEEFSKKDEVLASEYQYVHDAVFTDDKDQSGWFYHLWLLKQTVDTEDPVLVSSWPAHGTEILLGDSCMDSSSFTPFNTFRTKTFPLILYFDQAVEGVNSSTVTVEYVLDSNENLIWKPVSLHNSRIAQVWVTQLSFPDVNLHSSDSFSVEVTLGQCQGIVSSTGTHYSHSSHLSFTVHVQSKEKRLVEGAGLERISWTNNNFHLCEPHLSKSDMAALSSYLSITNEDRATATAWQYKIIAEEIELFKELSDSKIGKLTLARLLTAYDALMSSDKRVHLKEVLKLYCKLMMSDPGHSRYYKDLHSLVLLQQEMSSQESVLSRCFYYKDMILSSNSYPLCLRLNNLSLSRIGSVEKLLWVQMLDLSQNELQSIEGLEALQLLTYLNLSKNKLPSFTALGPLKPLKSLKVLDISHNEIGAHTIDTKRYLCSSPFSHSVGSEWEQDKIMIDGIEMTKYWEAFFALKGLQLTQLDVVGNAIADDKLTSFLVKILPKLKWLDGVQVN